MDQIKLSRSFRCSSGTRPQCFFSHTCSFSITNAFYVQKVGPDCRQSRPDLHLPTQVVIHQVMPFIVAAGLIQRSLLSTVLSFVHTSTREMDGATTRHHFGLGSKRPTGSSDLAQGTCSSAGSSTTSTQDFQTFLS